MHPFFESKMQFWKEKFLFYISDVYNILMQLALKICIQEKIILTNK
jgi:hypothetical protein